MSNIQANDGVLLLDIDVSQAPEPPDLLVLLQPYCGGQLTLEMIEDLLDADPLPKVQAYKAGKSVRCVSSFAVRAEDTEGDAESADESKAGRLVIQPVELLAGERWIISCWHRARATRDGSDEFDDLEPENHSRLIDNVAQRWALSGLASAGDLGLMVLYELAQSYTHTRRVMYAWHEQWELDFFRRREKTETETLLRMRGQIAALREHLEALNRPGMSKNPQLIWFAYVTDGAEAERVDDIVDRALANLRALGETLRASIDLHATFAFSEQSRRAEDFQELATIVAAVLLVPTLVAGVYGANTKLPGEKSWLGFGLMLAAMVLSAVVTLTLVRRRQRRARES